MRNERYVSNTFPTSARVIQGSVINTMIHGVFIDDLITGLNNSNLEVRVSEEIVHGLLYNGTAVILSNVKDNMKNLLHACELHNYKWNCKFQLSKCHVLAQNVKSIDSSNLSTNFISLQKDIQREFSANTSKIRKKKAPLVANQLIDAKIVHAINIPNQNDVWDLGWFTESTQIEITEHYKINHDRKYVFQWKAMCNMKSND